MEGLVIFFLLVGGVIVLLPIIAMITASKASTAMREHSDRIRWLEHELGRQNDRLERALRRIHALEATGDAVKSASPAVPPAKEDAAQPSPAPVVAPATRAAPMDWGGF